MYATTFWSYLGGLWNLVFLLSPIMFLFTAISPVSAYSLAFYQHILPFLIANELAFMVGTWGLSGWRAKNSYLAFFPVNLRALWTVLRGQAIKFPVTPKDRQEGNFLHLVWPQAAVIVLTLAGLAYAALQLALGSAGYSLGGLVANGFWGLNNVLAMGGLVLAAFWRPEPEPLEPEPDASSGLAQVRS
jgi:cellulose synthase (UDP-forming)